MAPLDDSAFHMPMTSSVQDLIGEHPSIVALRDLIARVARSKARNVLIYGETGTGKGLVARMIHQQSARCEREFIDINCAAIPSSLLESELFGYERGAFTGAIGKKEGLIEAADGGTVFLDEIRELDPIMQAKMLSLLDTQRFRRVGSVKPTSVDVRFIAATNKILLSEVKAGNFREDLYYRLQVIAVNMPALRERGDDIFVLTSNFLSKFNTIYDSRIRKLEPAVKHVFRTYTWPGNVRELENLLERICILEDGDSIRMDHIPQRIVREVENRDKGAIRAPDVPAGNAASSPGTSAETPIGYHEAAGRFQRELIASALARAHGNIGDAAAHLGLSRHALRHQMVKLGMVKRVSDGSN